MPFLARCPYCRHGAQAPDRALGASVKCPGCASWYTATAEDPSREPRPAPAPAPAPSAPAPVRDTQPAESGGGTATATAPEPAPLLVPAPAPLAAEPTQGYAPDPGAAPDLVAVLVGGSACLLAAAALATASFPSTVALARPLAFVGALVGACGAVAALLAERPAKYALPLSLGGGAVAGLTLLAAWFVPGLLGPGYEASRARSDYDPEAVRAIPLRVGAAGELPDPTGFVDASKFALQKGTVRVQITGAAVAPVQVVDAKRRFTKQSLLAVVVRVQHLGHWDRFRFTHWGTAGARAVPPVVATADGRPLAPANLGRDVPVGVTFGADVYPGKAVEDVLLLDPPDGAASPGAVAAVRVELPAEAWGGAGAFRFHVPGPMISIQPAKKPR